MELSTLSEKGRLVIAENSDHEVYLEKPDIIIQNLKTFIQSQKGISMTINRAEKFRIL